jgi:hypothetical protein
VYGIAKLPEANRINPRAACTDVIGVGTLFAIGACTFRLCEAYHYDDWQPLFHSAVEVVVQRHLAQTLTGKPEVLRLADSSRERALSVSAGSDLIWRAIGSSAWSGDWSVDSACWKPPNLHTSPFEEIGSGFHFERRWN